MQILINLISNAQHALSQSDAQPKVIRIRLRRTPENRIRIETTDNGGGIDPDHLTRIFQHGFTTRADGHGFGLHSSAIAAREMGGVLSVSSDGSGHGATFTLDLPYRPMEASDDRRQSA